MTIENKDFNPSLFADDLINWYQSIKRDLPWRENQDPYRVWISEIMLQQTQVSTVIPYFLRFVSRFPTVYDLANAIEEDVLKAWEGLGYYSRARNLQTAAKTIVLEHDGEFPKDYDSILALKGIGTYTAGAISSIAFDNPKPAVDGNVMRVMSRVLDIWDDIALAKTKKQFEIIIEEIISQEDPSSYNQGLMELGALICTPKAQACFKCPVSAHCLAYQKGHDDQLPVKVSKTKQTSVSMMTGIVQDESGRFLMRKRPELGLLANMWEFVQSEGKTFDDLKEHLSHHYNIELSGGELQGEVKHVFSHRIWNMHVFKAKMTGEVELPSHLRWMTEVELEEVPISTAHKKVMSYL
jgi:A/G-specific adenine glycosylase